MSHLLVWPLSLDLKIVLNAHGADLGTITCCDTFDMVLRHHDNSYFIHKNMTGCMLDGLKQMLELLVSGKQMTGRFDDGLLLGRDQLGHFLVEIREQQKPLSYSVVTTEVLQSWIAQLELLAIVMEENENEKKNRGTGCCG